MVDYHYIQRVRRSRLDSWGKIQISTEIGMIFEFCIYILIAEFKILREKKEAVIKSRRERIEE